MVVQAEEDHFLTAAEAMPGTREGGHRTEEANVRVSVGFTLVPLISSRNVPDETDIG